MNRASSRDQAVGGGESGVILLTVAAAILVILFLIAVTIDFGQLYRTRLRLQKAVDAAALAGLGYRAQRGWTYISGNGSGITKDSEVETRAREALLLNLQAVGINPSVTSGTGAVYSGGAPILSPARPGGMPTYRSSTDGLLVADSIWVSVSYDVPLLLLNRIPFHLFGLGRSAGAFTLNAFAHAQLSPANIALVLDTSGSMGCPSKAHDPNPSDPCACRRTQSCAFEFPGKLKIDALKNGAKTFLDYFNPGRDRITLVPFNLAAADSAEGFVSMHQASGAATSFDKAALKSRIDNLGVGSGTNTCDGMMKAITDMSETEDPDSHTPVLGTQPAFMVVFTDGAPSAGRFWLRNRAPSAPTLTGATPRLNDYSLYTIQWSEAGREWPGPSPLLPHENVQYLQRSGSPNGAYCGINSSAEGTLDPLKCVTNLGFDTLERTDIASDVSLRDYRQQYYHCAIEQSDYFRSRRGAVFTIGSAPPAMPDSTDPYQNVATDFSNKSYLLHRLAFDIYHGRGEPEFGRQLVTINDPSDSRYHGAPVQVGYDKYRNYAALETQFAGLEGDAYLTDDDAQLPYIFSRVAKTILLRLGF